MKMNLCVVAALVAYVGLPTSISAHIVPPEEYHEVAEAQRTIAFLVNLNPVLWDLVDEESAKISAGYDGLATAEGTQYGEAIDDLIMMIEAEAAVSLPTPTLRKETARRVFELSTRAVARLIELHLVAAESHLGEYEIASGNLEAARAIWESFAHEVKATDLKGFRNLGAAWLEAASALGHPGVVGVGVKPADTEIFNSATRAIRDYVANNFSGFEAQTSGWMYALPTQSPTFDGSAVVPAKLPPGSNLNKQLPRPRQLLNFAERGVSESETALIALGDMVFDSPNIFGGRAQELQISCNSCHNKGVTNPNFFIPGLSSVGGGLDVNSVYFAPHANNGLFDPVDIPDLRGIKYTAPYGRNGRIASLREFVRTVIVHEFNGPEPAPIILDSMLAYLNEFDFLPNEYLGATGKLTNLASEASRRGEKLFYKEFAQMNDMSCATCHVPSSHFADGQTHDIGSVGGASVYSTDGAMDTPTLLSAAYTAPYFHDGRLPTLASVVDWFDENFELGLSESDRADLTAYVETIGSGEESYEDTMYTLEAELEEFSFFLSSYEYVRLIGNSDLAAKMFKTIRQEIAAHKWDVQDTKYMPVLNELESLMAQAYEAETAGDTAKVDRLLTDYRALHEEYAGIIN